MDKAKIVEKVKEIATSGKISCSDARKLAKDLKVEPNVVGEACDEANIKICACELGCF
ncbi:hypothetical protein SYNTR_0163 [Candidatus Syntrophocurvum alkaliphilum]|uniref:Uncharacterized protein n=1 Tax=Candidatus Syntrophocurvum alkaliphilum TaxID=2293317 RepID=A0A6I6D5X8_9FIRM|nr:hypothetical protein [Candidatus Syntrophocurvum alkaliphilum]QGT98756.1 hypothetical protein SYNTR_0163 [Candidatus Syntrophocurvum alkaliphilum]